MEHDDVTLQLATRAHETPLANLLELYLHDMSETFPIRISDEGRFGYAWLPTYWAEPERRFAYFIRKSGGLAGTLPSLVLSVRVMATAYRAEVRRRTSG